MTALRTLLFSLAVLLGLTIPVKAEGPFLSVPVRCAFGDTCFIQGYPDWAPQDQALDYRCGSQTRDGQKSLSIRLRDHAVMRKGVPVLAAAQGLVVAIRDGMPDETALTPKRRKALQGRQCGNNVILAHGRGWRTQYCHLRADTVNVKVGDKIQRGHPLGLIGRSGAADYAHLAFYTYFGDKPVDPFAGQVPEKQCGGKQQTLWLPDSAQMMRYQAVSVMAIGFSAEAMTSAKAADPGSLPTTSSPALVAYANLINLTKGDQVRLTLQGPDGTLADNQLTIKENQAQRLVFNGRRLEGNRWAPGEYVASVQVLKGDQLAAIRTATLRFER